MKNQINYQEVLNPAQLEAVMTLDGPILVIAGAGSGKTRTLIYRVARLVDTGIPPEAILLLTFTRKAAREMLDRAAGLSDVRCRFVSGGTFHSLALKVLRKYADLLGFSKTFTILDRSDMEEIIHSIIPELQLPKGTVRFPKRSTLANILSKAANIQDSVDSLMNEEYGQFLEFAPRIERLGTLYADYKKTNQMMDYDDLILNLRKLLAENEEVRKALSLKYRYVMVDEYQDTNAIQSDIVKWLTHDNTNIMVVGDDSQSIYSFRGADYRNMFDFPVEFPKVKIIKLEENYRSIQPILTFTNALMEQASEKYTKCLFTKRQGKRFPRVVDTRTEPAQAGFVCRYVKEHMQKGRPINDIAVLFRAGYHSFELEARLTREKIPYVKYGGFKFLESAHIKDFLAHLRVMVNSDAVSWARILRLIENVGQVKTNAIIKWMRENRIPPERINEWPGAGKKVRGLKPLAGLFARLARLRGMKPEKAVEYIMEYYMPVLQEKFDDYPRRQKELEQLIPMAGRYKKMRILIDDLVLEPPNSPANIILPHGADSSEKQTLTLSTVHSAKGLEWSIVIIIWAMNGRFPSSRAYDNPLSLEEERRLMYVASTRAKDQLIICYPGKESMPAWSINRGGSNNFRTGLSSFISDLPQNLVSYESTGVQGKFSDHNRSSISLEGLCPGDKVRHPAFGPGVISKFIADNKVEVFFRNVGRKLLHLDYTTLEKA